MKAIITGATKGIGLAVVEQLAAQGFDLAICSRSATDLLDLKTHLTQRYPKLEILTQATDIRQKDEVIDFANFIKNQWSAVDILVNNGGVFLPGQIAHETDGALEMMIETNLYSAYHLTRAILPLMLPHRKGHIFNMCSIASLVAYPNGGSYSISKFAMLGMSKVLREELKPHGIRVTAILPGATWSNSWAGFEAPDDRLMKPEDIAATLWSVYCLSQQTVVEEVILRPQLGDL